MATVKELIQKLQEFDSNLEVLTEDRELYYGDIYTQHITEYPTYLGDIIHPEEADDIAKDAEAEGKDPPEFGSVVII